MPRFQKIAFVASPTGYAREAAAALIAYLKRTQKSGLEQIRALRTRDLGLGPATT